MRDDAIALTAEELHPAIPAADIERPTVREDDGPTFAPILVEDLRTVFGGNVGDLRFSIGKRN
jgi:hypothetical protein